MNHLPQIDAIELGNRLRIARETANLTQDVAAREADVARTTLVAIEKGQRAVRPSELQVLSRFYGVSVNSLLRNEAVHVDLVPRFRTLSETDDPAIAEAARMLNDLVRAEVELENILGVQRTRSYPPERPILPGDVRAQAEQAALELRQWLGLGEAPIHDLFSMMELQLGIRVYTRKLGGKVSGLFAFDDTTGPCILINATHRRDRRIGTGGHEVGHFIGTRRWPEVYEDEKHENSREERYANAFARAFLTPARTVMQKCREVTAGSTHLTRRHVIVLAHFFSVSRQAMVLRLEELGLARKGTWDWFADNGNITDDQARQVVGDSALVASEHGKSASARLFLLAIEANKKGLISEGQMSEMLKLGRKEVRALVDEAAADEDEVDDLFKLPH